MEPAQTGFPQAIQGRHPSSKLTARVAGQPDRKNNATAARQRCQARTHPLRRSDSVAPARPNLKEKKHSTTTWQSVKQNQKTEAVRANLKEKKFYRRAIELSNHTRMCTNCTLQHARSGFFQERFVHTSKE